MRTAQTMYRIITRLAETHDVDLTQVGACLILDMPNADRLVIETPAANQVAIMHFAQTSDSVADTRMTFFSGYGDPQHQGHALWIPIAIQQNQVDCRVAELNDAGTHIECDRVQEQAEVASFANSWARELVNHGWLVRSVKGN